MAMTAAERQTAYRRNRQTADKPDREKLLTITERAIAAAAQLAEAKDVPPELREQFETLLSRSLPSVKRRQAALPAPADGEAQ
jgi:hypothetical protein